MAGINMHQVEELQPEVGSLEDQLRLREEIERQLEVEREAARAMTQDKLDREKLLRQAANRNLRQEETRQTHTSSQNSKHAYKRRSYGMDALLLCAVTLGMGALLGPIMHPAPVMYASHNLTIPPSGPGLPAGGLMRAPFQWDGTSIDNGGNDWSGSRMTFDREVTMSNGKEFVEGHADWNVSGDYVGSEQFSGSYDPATGQLDVAGTSINQANMGTGVRLVPGEYTATISADGQILNGYMKGAPGVSAIPGPFGGGQMNP